MEVDLDALTVMAGDPVYGVTYIFNDEDGAFLSATGRIEALSDSPWQRPAQIVPKLAGYPGGVIVAETSSVSAFDLEGAELWEREEPAPVDGVIALDGGESRILLRNSVVALASDGSVSWEAEIESGNTSDRFLSFALLSDGGVAAMRSVIVDPDELVSEGRIVYFDPNGEQGDVFDTTNDSFVLAADAEGNLYFPVEGRSLLDRVVAKHDPELNELWRSPILAERGGFTAVQIDADGAPFVLLGGKLLKLVP